MVRADAIVGIDAVPAGEVDTARWERMHPAQRIGGGLLARVVVTTNGGEQGSVITCPGRAVPEVIAEFVQFLAALTAEPGRVRFLRGRWHNWLGKPRPWTVSETPPEPDWAYGR